MNHSQVKELISHITFSIFSKELKLSVHYDKLVEDMPVQCKYKRMYLQVSYTAPCTKSGTIEEWKGGKHYLSRYMTEDEIVKKAYVAFEAAVKHEIMEGFKFDNTIVFNPHVDFRELLKISHKEVKRA